MKKSANYQTWQEIKSDPAYRMGPKREREYREMDVREEAQQFLAQQREERLVPCIGCGQIFYAKRPNQLRCKVGCRIRRGKGATMSDEDRQLARDKAFQNGRESSACELRVAASMLESGWDVCMPVSGTCAFDILAYKQGKTVRVQVKKGRVVKNILLHGPVTEGTYDVLAIIAEGNLIYVPDPSEW